MYLDLYEFFSRIDFQVDFDINMKKMFSLCLYPPGEFWYVSACLVVKSELNHKIACPLE